MRREVGIGFSAQVDDFILLMMSSTLIGVISKKSEKQCPASGLYSRHSYNGRHSEGEVDIFHFGSEICNKFVALVFCVRVPMLEPEMNDREKLLKVARINVNYVGVKSGHSNTEFFLIFFWCSLKATLCTVNPDLFAGHSSARPIVFIFLSLSLNCGAERTSVRFLLLSGA